MSDEQTVTATEPEAQPSGQETGSAQDDDLDAILSQYDEQNVQSTTTQTTTQPAPAQADTRIDEIAEWVRAKQIEDSQRETRDLLDNASQYVLEATDVPLSAAAVSRAIHGYAAEDDSIRRGLLMRRQNPVAYKAALKRLSQRFAEEFKVSRRDDDREAVVAAVKGAQTTRPQPDPDFPSDKHIANMTDAEFAQFQRKLIQG